MTQAKAKKEDLSCTGLFQIVVDNFPTNRIPDSPFYRFLWLCLFYGLRPSCPVRITTPDYQIMADPRNRQTLGRRIMKEIIYEPVETKLFRDLIRPGMNIVDIGANFGHFTLISAAALKGHGQVYAFEPTPVCFAELEQNIRLNGFENIQAFNMAVSDEDGEVEMFMDIRRGGHHSMARENVRELQGSVMIKAVSLDNFELDAMGGAGIDLIKMDTQGAEGAILKGARKVLEKYHPMIVMEFWPTGLERFGAQPWDILDDLKALDYDIRVIEEDRTLTPAGKAGLRERLIPMGEKGSLNLLLRKPDQ